MLVAELDDIYAAILEDSSATYDWCGQLTCFSTIAIVGIVVGALIGLGLIVFAVRYFMLKKKQQAVSKDSQSSLLEN
jgi:hypothetical protein